MIVNFFTLKQYLFYIYSACQVQRVSALTDDTTDTNQENKIILKNFQKNHYWHIWVFMI